MKNLRYVAVIALPLMLCACPASTALSVANEVQFIQTAIDGVLPLSAALAAAATGNPALMLAATEATNLTNAATSGINTIQADLKAGQTVEASDLAGVEATLSSLETLLITNGQPVPASVTTAIAKAQGTHRAIAALTTH